ncbi:hypothetical protein GCM10009628_33970 [Paeniglutamicibacter kerguelensis]
MLGTTTVLLLGGGMLLATTACIPQYFGSRPCMPPDYVVAPSSLRAGEDLKISAPDATCDPRYGERAQIQIELLNGQNEVLLTKLAPMGDAGSFEHTLRIPATTKPGSYSISASPFNVDWCDDTGKNNRLENPGFGQSGVIEVRAACATPYVAFRVVK